MPAFEEEKTYEPAVQVQIDSVESKYQGDKNTLMDEHRLLGAQVRNGEIDVSALRAFERDTFDPAMGAFVSKRQGDKKVITDKVV